MKEQDLLGSSQLLTGRDDEIKALDELFARSANYRNGQNYLKLLEFINRLPSLSPFNAFLIHMQHPGVQYVATSAQWKKKFKRTPKRDARPLVILIPYGPVSFVYDVSETEGGQLAMEFLRPFETVGRLSQNIYALTLENCKRDFVDVHESDFGPGKAGYAQRSNVNFSISINKNYSLEDKYSTLAHELGHIFCGHVGKAADRWWPDRCHASDEVKEIEAESISFLVCKRMRLSTTSEKYLSSYVQRHNEFPPFSLETVLTVAGYIERMGKERMKPRKPEERKKR